MKKKRIGLFAGLLSASVLLAACGGAGDGGSDSATTDTGSKDTATTETSKPSESENTSTKDTISWMTMLHTPTPPSGAVEEALEEYTGIDIDFNWVPDASKEERINAALSSDTLTDIVSLTQITNTTVVKL